MQNIHLFCIDLILLKKGCFETSIVAKITINLKMMKMDQERLHPLKSVVIRKSFEMNR